MGCRLSLTLFGRKASGEVGSVIFSRAQSSDCAADEKRAPLVLTKSSGAVKKLDVPARRSIVVQAP